MDIFKTGPPPRSRAIFLWYVFLIVASGNVWRRRRRRETLAWNGCKKFSTDATRVWLRWTDLRGGKPQHPLIFLLFSILSPTPHLFFCFSFLLNATDSMNSSRVPDESKYKKRLWLLMDSFFRKQSLFLFFWKKEKTIQIYSAFHLRMNEDPSTVR